MLLSEGYNVYFGPAKEAVPYFSKLGYACPSTYNPSDWFLDVISLDVRSANHERQSRKRIQFLAEAFHDYEKVKPWNPSHLPSFKDATNRAYKS